MKDSDKATHASTSVDATTNSSPAAEDAGVKEKRLYSDPKADAKTGATPGVATACRDLGVGDLSAALSKFNCKPPGQ